MNTSTHDEPRRGPGRPRKEEVQERRRKRTGETYAHGGMRMGVDPDLLDHTQFKYRWVNDDERRLLMKTKHDDWEIMTDSGGAIKEDSTDLGSAVSAIVGQHPDGSSRRAYLCRKLKKWWMEDQAEKQTTLDEQLERLRVGQDRHGAPQAEYVPHSGIKLR